MEEKADGDGGVGGRRALMEQPLVDFRASTIMGSVNCHCRRRVSVSCLRLSVTKLRSVLRCCCVLEEGEETAENCDG